ncbi:MAG TPA: molybdenum cofactor guanylyltransferase [Candidatus Paceibacterota bacterium]|nr:molybdenum cofactor guanylyltransferase [Kiritimatiellia bacterium]HRT56096.1 molybdenum cofactor guanylyltransferase [Candidatus Paceibacterota bacterium]
MSEHFRRSSPTSPPSEWPALTAVILAGGESRRMGRDKAWLEWNGHPLIVHAVEKARALGAAEIYISGRVGTDYSALRLPVLTDLVPGLGPLGGIERGLRECASPLLLVLAVDLPRITLGMLTRLRARCDHWTGVVPALPGGLEPLAAIYPRRCHTFAFAAITQGRRAARDFAKTCLQEGAVRTFPVAPAAAGCFTNWNAPADCSPPKV